MKSLRSTLLLSALLALTAPACSESHTSEGTDSGVSIAFDAPATATDAGGGGGTDSGGGGGTDGGGVVGEDGGGVVVVDAGGGGGGTDAGGGGGGSDAGPPGVTCGTETCTDPDICCVTFSGGGPGGGTPMYACTAAADCMGVAAACDGPEDCAAGEACCGSGGAGGGGMASCTAEADCGFIRLCHTAADCAAGDMCCSFMGASVCSGFGCGFGP